MFDNLSKSEKRYALILACMVPCIGLFFGVTHFSNKYSANKQKLRNVEKQIKSENAKTLDAITADTRRAYYYRKISFPTNSDYITDYQDWLEKLIRECGMGYTRINKKRPTTFAHKGEDNQNFEIGVKEEFEFDCKGNLGEIIQFCYEFEKLDLLHRIKEVILKPVFEKNVLTGKCTATFKVELLALEDADEDRDVFSATRPLAKSLEDYTSVVVSRNIFGPANNAPRLSLSSKSYHEDDDISFTLSGRDDDKNDVLRYEIVDDGGLEGAQIESKKVGKRTSFKFTSPAQAIGEYKIVLRAIDNGFPEKSDDAECKITVKAKPPKKKDDPVVEVKPEPTRFAGSTQINRISSIGAGGVFEAKIRCRPSGQVFELTKGDEFELDDQTWIVRDVGENRLHLETDGKLLEFRAGNFLDKPLKETAIKNSDLNEVSSTGK